MALLYQQNDLFRIQRLADLMMGVSAIVDKI